MDLEKDGRLKGKKVQLLSVMVDPPSALAPEVGKYEIKTPVLTDTTRSTCSSYRINCQAMGGKPGHAFVLIGKDGNIKWTKDYGSLMYVDVDTIYQEVAKRVGSS